PAAGAPTAPVAGRSGGALVCAPGGIGSAGPVALGGTFGGAADPAAAGGLAPDDGGANAGGAPAPVGRFTPGAWGTAGTGTAAEPGAGPGLPALPRLPAPGDATAGRRARVAERRMANTASGDCGCAVANRSYSARAWA